MPKTTSDRIPEKATSPKALEVDWALYEGYLENADLSEAEKRQFLEALWSIIVAFVDLGWGLHPVQQCCGQVGMDSAPELASLGADVVNLKEVFTPSTRHSDAAPARPPRERSRAKTRKHG